MSPEKKTNPDKQGALVDWTSTEKTLSHWHSQAALDQRAHYDSARYYASHNTWLGILVMIFSTFVGGNVFATLDQPQTGPVWRGILVAISVGAAILSALQTFLNYAQRVEKHHKAAVEYGAVCFEIESIEALPIGLRPPPEDILSEMKDRLELLERESPELPRHIWEKYKSKYNALEKALEFVPAGRNVA
jgi:hypothetical protein